MFGLLRTHRLIFQDVRDVGGGVTSFTFRSAKPLGALAGQHGIFRIGAAAIKPFSLASAPEEGTVLVGTSLASGSAFKQCLAALEPGDTATLHGPVSKFTLDGARDQIVMLAQGVGITPFRSMLAHIALTGTAIHSSLIHVARAGHAYRQDTERWAPSADYPTQAEQFRAGAVAATRAYPDATFYIAGASSFVSSTASLLREFGIAPGSIRQDKYLGYKPRTQAPGSGASGTASPG